jgi:hypothetical protein
MLASLYKDLKGEMEKFRLCTHLQHKQILSLVVGVDVSRHARIFVRTFESVSLSLCL